ncbi:MAG TPA: DUF433 domain-containing protein [Ktedonobacterales bacterium]|jgi:uncharacterized protein (DUF433 family)|nr:DUF433 domain-containing protein [Ktedonobacterales bacterium]
MPKEVFPGITVDPAVQHGRPCLAGTRTPVVSIVGALAGGSSLEQVTLDYFVTEDQIRAALAYVTHMLDSIHVYAAS